MRIGILGAGFGLALGVMFYRYGHAVTIWSNSKREIAVLQADNENRLKLPGVLIPAGVVLSADPTELSECDIIISSVPTFACRDALRAIAPYIRSDAVIVNTSKGFEAGADGALPLRMSEVMAEVLPSHPCVVITGPSHAEEVGRGVPTAVTAASLDESAMLMIENELSNEVFRIYHNNDIIGCELGGALKNIIALACGICDGLEKVTPVGDNTKAALMTRGLSEIARLGIALGASRQTFAGLSGLGDLIVTCTSMHSRNRRAGILIGEGTSPSDAVAKTGTVEGFFCTKSALEFSKALGVPMPITEQTYNILYANTKPIDALSILMDRPTKEENDKFWG
ncbi:MAG: NAD(P)-dependent glycerol-3-phosphate dehydrogenase [Ruminococcus sp.]|jgi:glycerol-3-phosphate dehydrogenase (NAD(P)+)|nr:NAD(P)-dependent glycerol-3-phosphate dehydrogenase [Ruminococcus sp.]